MTNKSAAQPRRRASRAGLPPRMAVAVDLVILTLREDTLCALAIERGIAPFRGRWALPGGFVRAGESLEAAALRELEEETGVDAARAGHIEQLATFGDPQRDPRERVVSVAYLAIVPDLPEPRAGGDARDARVLPVATLLSGKVPLAFDHARILDAGVERARAKLEYSSLATHFCAESFTIHALRRVYEAVWGAPLDGPNFHRKVLNTPGFVVETDQMSSGGSGRPARLYRRGGAIQLQPPLLRAEPRAP
ncbi:MAG: NUDIX hydrolase [Betaproteobacteria bacterium]|nr:NUDIX hydrolase [Betaproteobacteria bacterium]